MLHDVSCSARGDGVELTFEQSTPRRSVTFSLSCQNGVVWTPRYWGSAGPKDWARHSPGVSLSHQGPQTTTDGRAARRWQHQKLAYIDILASQNSREFSAKRRAIRNRGASRVSVQPLGTRSPSSSQPASIRDAAAAPPEFQAQRQQPHKTCSRVPQRDRSCWSKAPRPRLRDAAPPCPPWAQPRGARNSCGHRWRHVAPSP